jgi:hypothetical protein
MHWGRGGPACKVSSHLASRISTPSLRTLRPPTSPLFRLHANESNPLPAKPVFICRAQNRADSPSTRLTNRDRLLKIVPIVSLQGSRIGIGSSLALSLWRCSGSELGHRFDPQPRAHLPLPFRKSSQLIVLLWMSQTPLVHLDICF